MVDISQLRDVAETVCRALNTQCVDCSWETLAGQLILQVQIENADGTMDLDTCTLVSDALSEALDEIEALDFEYSLEVCSPGAERPLPETADRLRAVGDYIFVALHSGESLEGVLLSYDEDGALVEYRDKQAIRKKQVKREDIAKMRKAVKV